MLLTHIAVVCILVFQLPTLAAFTFGEYVCDALPRDDSRLPPSPQSAGLPVFRIDGIFDTNHFLLRGLQQIHAQPRKCAFQKKEKYVGVARVSLCVRQRSMRMEEKTRNESVVLPSFLFDRSGGRSTSIFWMNELNERLGSFAVSTRQKRQTKL